VCYFLLWGVHEGLGEYVIPIDTIEVLRERVENAATTVRNNRGRLLERVEEWFRRRLYYCIMNITVTVTEVTLNTSCND
jgi:hypothetical protein